MPASTNQTPDAKYRQPILFVLIAISALSFMFRPSPPPTKEEMLAKMNEYLRGGNFARLYDETDDTLHRNVSREKFVVRMNVVAAKLKEIDGGLNFKRDAIIEGVISGGDSDILSAAQTLEHNGKSATVLIHWDKQGKFIDMSVLPKHGTPEGYAVRSVSYDKIRVGDRLVDY